MDSDKASKLIKVLARPALAIVFGFFGALVARGATPPLFNAGGLLFIFVAFLAFAVLGFILPDILVLAWKTGITALGKQIVAHIPQSTPTFPKIRFPRRKKEEKYQNPMIVDTSALIDGRLADIVATGFLFGTFLIIPSVVSELHKLSDSADSIKRGRGRRGLDNLAEIQAQKMLKVMVLKSEPKDDEVDAKLVKLAKQLGGKVITVDFNLNKVAKVQGVEILNLNDLANAIKTVVLPGERLNIQVISQGKEKEQGVGYLADGTMVVVEGGAVLVGKNSQVEVLRVLQTSAGKMIFAKSI